MFKRVPFLFLLLLGLLAPVYALEPLPPEASGYISLDMYYRHKDIDRYLFEDHIDDIKDRGITVTHTGPTKDGIEIGILPYNAENAEFLYKALGSEGIKVVEGIQVTLYTQDLGEEVTAFAPQDGFISSKGLQKQQEIDEYVASNIEDLYEKGINITYVKPKGDSVEIGIMPYSKEMADYLKEIFGDEIDVTAGTRLSHVTIGEDASSNLEVIIEESGLDLSPELALSAIAGGTVLLLLIIKSKKQHERTL